MWDENEKTLFEQSRDNITPIKKRTCELRQKQPGPRSTLDERRQFTAAINREISSLEEKKRSLLHVKKKYVTHLQLAQFYTHSISPQSEVYTRFDTVIRIEERGNHVRLVLIFSDNIYRDHSYYSRIGLNAVGPLTGVVERILPIENVTLEIIRRESSV